jgi:hypothetical protein
VEPTASSGVSAPGGAFFVSVKTLYDTSPTFAERTTKAPATTSVMDAVAGALLCGV